MVVTYANVILRRAQKTLNARKYIEDLIVSLSDDMAGIGGQIIGTTVNGKSTTVNRTGELSLVQQLAAAELALATLQQGLSSVPRSTWNVVR